MKPDIRYLSDNTSEVSRVAHWIYQEWGHLVEGRTYETDYIKVNQSLSPNEIPMTLVCYLDGELVGTAGIDHSDMSTHPEFTPWMVSVYVAPPFRKKGIGTALCQRIMDEFLRLGIKTAYLFTPDQENLYARLGWKTILREEYRGEQVAVMKLHMG